MSDAPLWEDLRDKLVAAVLAAKGSAGLWLRIWRCVVEHPWYRVELAHCANDELAGGVRSPESQAEAGRLAAELLAKELRRYTGIVTDQGESNQFGSGLKRVLRTSCRAAIQRSVGESRPTHGRAAPESAAARERRVDASLAIARLREPERSILHLHAKGLALEEIVDRLLVTRSEAQCALRHGAGLLRRLL